MATAHSLTVTRSARYFTLGEMSERTRHVWFVLHGYGQLAEYFIRKFEKISDEQTYVVAPEALSHFYLNGNSGRVGASWMTREDRLSEIDDYVAYLESIYKAVFLNHSPDSLRITLLGFSQGTATACRWLDRGRLRCDRLILWAGYFANGIREVIDSNRLPPQDTHYVYGNRDEYLTQLNLTEYLESLQTELPFLKVLEYPGGHAIDTEVLSSRFKE
ncbi:alpha/beta hydrolase [Salmonirosea aquatica]|uniref:Phospholipase n=1 Tax=Salmonirosea aquatica TaxID=2654236 RepID=A0A7C9F4Z2_9BACT|nr:phospholipase [Cytophagaceae bacterium SJW1-29]